ncbi:helix-turn-helix domain-containing protein [Kibdelosporangium phytohabitans]|uniref:helix-turn-helix domain-containing protein n=1 Tax=Kibdelosporangium phytohabitans TaxID=860235 RepID=UPI000A407F62|nr:helix-turn-helix transcriptional regulator [Kibdelosporangium phytohabitans]MBE1461218.1 transcriptional regulator with XRE-family HTH domain [Kibdelosporangium phytohabitans]
MHTRIATTTPPLWRLIPQLREQLGISQVTLARLLTETSGNPAVTRAEISRWERGKRIPGPYWRAWLSQVLDVSQDRLETAARSARNVRRSAGEPIPELAPYRRDG